MKQLLPLLGLLPLLAGTAGCSESPVSTGRLAEVSQAASVAAASAAVTGSAEARVAKVVFVDKQEACDCTRDRVAMGWDALQTALGGKSTPSVERLYVDTQPDQVQAYRAMRPMMAVPALYFLSADGALVAQLQGEISESQVRAALSGSP